MSTVSRPERKGNPASSVKSKTIPSVNRVSLLAVRTHVPNFVLLLEHKSSWGGAQLGDMAEGVPGDALALPRTG